MDPLLQDVRHGLRTLTRSPGFVVAAVLSLALGLGANTAIFSAVNTLLLKPLAVRDLDRTVYVFHATPDHPDRGTSFPAFQDYRDRTDTFSETMAITGARPMLMGDREQRESVYVEPVTSGFFAIADVRLLFGRPFDRDADAVTNPPLVAVLSHRFWQRRFASDPAIVGRAIVLNGQSFTVTAVAAPGFTGLDAEVASDLWVPMTAWAHVSGEPSRLTSDEHWLTTIARLRDGVTLEQAQAAMAAAGRSRLVAPDQQTRVRSIRERSAGPLLDTITIGAAAFGGGLLVLLLACTNVASLVIARAAARQREMSVRLALGGSRWRLIRLWLIETAIVSLMAAIAGLLIASWLLDLVVAFKPPTLIGDAGTPTLPLDFHLDARVFLFTLGLAALTSVIVGLMSGLQSTHQRTLRQATAGRSTDRRFAPGLNLRSVVLASQMALSLILLIPCGLLVRSWLQASTMAPGFSTERVLLLPISSDQSGIRVKKPARFDQELVARVARLPGVVSATAMDPVPLWFAGNYAQYSTDTDRAMRRVGHSRIEPGYFATLQMPLLRGRDFTAVDDASAPPVAIVSETMARQFWPDGGAVGRQIRDGEKAITIVGVASDTKYVSLADRAQPWIYQPLAQEPTENRSLSLAVRFDRDSPELRASIEREVRALVPAWPAFPFRTLDEGIALQRLVPRLGATFLGILGAIGLLLAAVGIYGVTAYVVRQRARELGIRLALGSPGSRVIGLVIRQSMVVCAVGAAVGLAIALGATRFLEGMLVGTGASDPFTYAIVSMAVATAALLAGYLPARHVARANLVDVLREE